jgi:hypothetical protein
MLADRIQGGTLESINSTTIGGVTYKNFSLNMTTGAIEALKLSIKSANFTLTESGIATMNGATIKGSIESNANGNRVKITGGTMEFYGTDRYGAEHKTCVIKGAAQNVYSAKVEDASGNLGYIDANIWGDECYFSSTGSDGIDCTLSVQDDQTININGRTITIEGRGDVYNTPNINIGTDLLSHVEIGNANGGVTINGNDIQVNGNITENGGMDATSYRVGGTIGWSGVINGVSDGNGHYGDITVSYGIITDWSGWY